MDIRSFLIANPQSSKLMKPTICAFHNPPINTQAAAIFGISFGEHRFDAATPQSLAMAFGIIRTITLARWGRRRLPRLLRIFGIASTSGINCVTSCALAPVKVVARGMPLASVST